MYPGACSGGCATLREGPAQGTRPPPARLATRIACSAVRGTLLGPAETLLKTLGRPTRRSAGILDVRCEEDRGGKFRVTEGMIMKQLSHRSLPAWLLAALLALPAGSLAGESRALEPVGNFEAVEAPSAQGADLQMPPRFAEDIRFRREFGLNASLAHIRRLHNVRSEAAPRSEANYGVLLTPSEQNEMRRRDRVSNEVGEVRQWAIKNVRDRFGGIWIDQDAGGLVYAAFTDDPERYRPRIEAMLSEPQNLRLQRASYSEAELDALHARIGSETGDLHEEGIEVREISTATDRNTVQIGVASADSRTVSNLENRYGPGRVEVYQAETVDEAVPPGTLSSNDAAGSRYNDYPPLRGGLYMDDFLNYSCTMGFAAQNSNGFRQYMVTAGHCIRKSRNMNGINWRHSAVTIGANDLETYTNNSQCDCGTVVLNAGVMNDNSIYLSSGSYQDVTTIEVVSQDSQGQSICMSGVTSGVVCGTLESRNVTVMADGKSFPNQRRASFIARDGDSGGPVYRNARAVGIVAFRLTSNNNKLAYSHVGYIQSYLSGVYIKTS